MTLWTIVELGLVFVLLEVCLFFVIKRLRVNFPWLIMENDINPVITIEDATKFFNNSHHPRYGWLRKAGSSFHDVSEGKKVLYEIDAKGRRHNPVNTEMPPSIAIFGDSFAFGRLVAAQHTIAAFLSQKCDTHVSNYGFGNYGLDQALLRLEDEIESLSEEYVIFCFVPETIARIQSIWKHYFEYGNTLAFKPRFSLAQGKLQLLENKITSIEKLVDYKNTIKGLQERDPFYNTKFKRDLLSFPFSLKLALRASRHLPILTNLIIKENKTG